MLKGVLFDMDGVLFDTERLHLEIDDALLREMGYQMSDEMRNKTYGINSAAFLALLQEYFGPNFDYDHYIVETYRRFLNYIDTHGMPEKPGARAALQHLREKGFLLALASSSRAEIVAHHLKAAHFEEFFTTVVSGNMVQRSKPAPDIFLMAAQNLGLAPSACAVVEDSFPGVAAAKAAGCLTLMVPDQLQPSEEIKAQADAVLPDLASAAAFIVAAAETLAAGKGADDNSARGPVLLP